MFEEPGKILISLVDHVRSLASKEKAWKTIKMEIKLMAKDNLAPVRNQMMDLIVPNSKVIEFGCGDGVLLFKLSQKIKSGLGIDKSKTLIDQALKHGKSKNISNVDFVCEALGKNFNHSETYDFSIASLFFHVITVSDAVYLLNKMRELSDTVLICGFSRPDRLQQKSLLWLDQRFSGHYGNFKAYQKYGYMEGILEKIQFASVVTYDTSVPFIKIYKTVSKHNKK